jgi:hypothetical protein
MAIEPRLAAVVESMQRLLADGDITGYEERDANGVVVGVVATGVTEKGKLRLGLLADGTQH